MAFPSALFLQGSLCTQLSTSMPLAQLVLLGLQPPMMPLALLREPLQMRLAPLRELLQTRLALVKELLELQQARAKFFHIILLYHSADGNREKQQPPEPPTRQCDWSGRAKT